MFNLTSDERDVLFTALDELSEKHPENSETNQLIDSIWSKVKDAQEEQEINERYYSGSEEDCSGESDIDRLLRDGVWVNPEGRLSE